MSAFGEREEQNKRRDWLLRCVGMTVESTDGLVGRVVEPLYRHSARWDRPWALAVQGEHGLVTVPMEAVASVEEDVRRIRLDRPRGELRGPSTSPRGA